MRYLAALLACIVLIAAVVIGLTMANNAYTQTCVEHGGKIVTTRSGTLACYGPDGKELP